MSTLAPVTPEAPKLEQEVGALARRIDALAVTSSETFVEAGELLKDITAYVRRVEEIMNPIVTAAHKAHQVAVQQRTALLRPAETAKRLLGSRMATYEAEQARLRREAEESARRERERLEAEERARVAAEEARLRKEAEDRQLADAAAAEAAGDRELADRIVAQAPVITPPPPRPVLTPPVPVAAPPKVEGVAFRDNWKAEVADLMALVKAVAAGTQPITYLQANQVALNQVARALKGATAIPGVRAVNDRTTAARV